LHALQRNLSQEITSAPSGACDPEPADRQRTALPWARSLAGN